MNPTPTVEKVLHFTFYFRGLLDENELREILKLLMRSVWVPTAEHGVTRDVEAGSPP